LLQFLGKCFRFGRGSQVSDDVTEGIVTTLPAPEARSHKEFTCMNITCADPDCDDEVYCGANKSEVAQVNTEQDTGKIPVIFRFSVVIKISLFFQYS
jgi:hypothetical protein